MNALLCGAMILSAGTYTSCSYDDDDLKSRLTVVEGAIGELKEQLSKALTTGASIIEAKQVDGVWNLKLSNGQDIAITSSAGGSVQVVEGESSMTIIVDGVDYVIPFGAAVNSLIYSPEYADGIVNIGNDGATVNFLATPAVSAEALKNATFDIAEAHEVKTTRGGNGLFKVKGEVKLNGDFLAVPVKAIGAEAGKSYAVALLLKVGGTSISSNYFTVKVSDDFFFNAEEIGGCELKPEYQPKELADNFNEITINGVDLLQGISNFSSLFAKLPENAEFAIAPNSRQPGGKAQEKWDMLNRSLKADGTWAFSERPGTSFNDNEDRPGFLFNVVVDDVVKAKVYIVIKDELANVDFVANLAGLCSNHMEHPEVFAKGANKYDFAKEITAGNFDPKHGNTDKFIEAFKAYSIMLGEETIVYNNGETLEVAEFGKKFTQLSRGINWFNIQTSVTASRATEGGNGEIIAGWDGISGEDMKNLGLSITNDGFFATTAAYGGWGLRVGMGLEFEYDYGMKSISEGCLAFIFFNRGVSPDGVTNLDPR